MSTCKVKVYQAFGCLDSPGPWQRKRVFLIDGYNHTRQCLTSADRLMCALCVGVFVLRPSVLWCVATAGWFSRLHHHLLCLLASLCVCVYSAWPHSLCLHFLSFNLFLPFLRPSCLFSYNFSVFLVSHSISFSSSISVFLVHSFRCSLLILLFLAVIYFIVLHI